MGRSEPNKGDRRAQGGYALRRRASSPKCGAVSWKKKQLKDPLTLQRFAEQ